MEEDSNSIHYSMVYIPRTQLLCVVNGKQHFDFPKEGEKENRDENMRVIKQNFFILWLSIYKNKMWTSVCILKRKGLRLGEFYHGYSIGAFTMICDYIEYWPLRYLKSWLYSDVNKYNSFILPSYDNNTLKLSIKLILTSFKV